ncbi:MAG: prolyl oligopeptidase family serine peptidase [Planctomycetaceae bacterium]|nr:prolyl oligopeptidase family serine peptidase [Planctomycetaceae bacterium]
MHGRRAFLLAGLVLVFNSTLCAQDQDPPKVVKQLILPGESFLVEGRAAFVMLPPESLRRSPQPWIMYAPTLPAYPDIHEKWMHEQFLNAGIAVAGIDIGEAYGSPNGRRLMTALYDELVQHRDYAAKPALLGRSRGGLWVSSWAIEHPDRVAAIGGIYPVFDLTTYPGLNRAAPAYELSAEQLQQTLTQHNPIEQAHVLAEHRIPVNIIHGDVDSVVPLDRNSLRLKQIYEANGQAKLMQLTVAEGQGHNYWEGFFHCQPLVNFLIESARGSN